MHPRSVFRTKPNFALLAEKYPEFKQFCSLNFKNKLSYDFKNREAMKVLSETLLFHYFGLRTCIPSNRLVPTVPLRLNYILWIEDLISLLPLDDYVSESRTVRGIDIGCGSCAIYMLLGAKVNSWNFLGLCLESDYENVHSSLENITMNDLSDKIEVERVENGYALSDVLDPSYEYTFCLTNPPFFDTDISVSEAGSQVEVSTPGGEIAVITTLINHSLILQTRVKWFTALVGIKKNLAPLKARLKEIESVKRIETTEFRQGKTWRWGIAWTFCDNVTAPLPNYASKSHRLSKTQPVTRMHVKPVEWSVGLAEFSNLMHLDKDLEKFATLSKLAQNLLKEIKESTLDVVSDIPSCVKLKFAAKKVSWLHGRRQRRAEKKTPQKSLQSTLSYQTAEQSPNEIEMQNSSSNILKRGLQFDENDPLELEIEANEEDYLIQPCSKKAKTSDGSNEEFDSGISCQSSSGRTLHEKEASSPSISEASLLSNGPNESEIKSEGDNILSCSIVFKMSKQCFVMTFSTVDPSQKDNLNSLMLYVKGAINRFKAQNE